MWFSIGSRLRNREPSISTCATSPPHKPSTTSFFRKVCSFRKLSRRTILVADQTRRPQYQQLVLRTFFLSNMKPSDARQLIQQAIPPSVGRPQTIVVPDDATNSLTVRDTAENVRLIGDLLASIDKDRAEVVMDVNIYEVSRTDFAVW